MINLQTGLSRNTVRSARELSASWYPARVVFIKLDAYAGTLRLGLKAYAGQDKCQRRNKSVDLTALREMGYI